MTILSVLPRDKAYDVREPDQAYGEDFVAGEVLTDRELPSHSQERTPPMIPISTAG